MALRLIQTSFPSSSRKSWLSFLNSVSQATRTKRSFIDLNEAVAYRAASFESLAGSPLRSADEREDLNELQVRLDDVLDSLHGLSNTTRYRIRELQSGLHANLDDLDRQLRILRLLVEETLKVLPINETEESTGGGRPRYDDMRNTPLLALMAGEWFQQFPDDPGVKRDGGYADKGRS